MILLSESKDNSTLSNYLEITLQNLEGTFHPNFDTKIISGELIYTFKAKDDGDEIILDSKYLEIKNISEISPEEKTLNFTEGELVEFLGVPIKISRPFQKDDEIKIKIVYETTKEGGAALFLESHQTIGKKYPYFFTISEMIIGRQLLPSQDTPAVKFPFNLGIRVPNPLRGMISGLYDKNETHDDDTTTWYYKQVIPVPNYLIALAAGNIKEHKVNEQVSVYSEPEYVDEAVKEFEDIPKFLKYSQEYMGNYEWGKYNVLVLPHSFPYSGMENPCLTFCSPCLINGDKSLVDLIVHELMHSWSGNLVTNENWRDFWLNEGVTKFVQRKIISMWQNDDYAKMDYMLGLSYIAKYLGVFGVNNTLTSLRPNLTGMSPDDSYSNIPYEKGSNFVYYLQSIVGEDIMQKFFQSYFDHFKYKSVDVFDFKNYFLEFVQDKVEQNKIDSILWDEWIFKPGDCPVKNDFENIYNDELINTTQRFLDENDDYEGLDEQFINMSSTAKTVFFLRLEERNIFLTDKQHKFLTETLKLYEKQNYLVTTHYLRLILKETKEFLPNELDSLIRYLTSFGVTDFMDGVYRLFYKRDEVKAVEVFNNCSNFYHSLMKDMVQREFNDAKNTFPIISFDFEEKCPNIITNNKFKITSEEFKPFENDVIIDVNNKILLKAGSREIKVSCHLNSTETYCIVNPEDLDTNYKGEYYIYNPKRIQEKEFAIKTFEGHSTSIIKEDNIKEISIDYNEKESTTLELKFERLYQNEIKILKEDKEFNCDILLDAKKIMCEIDKNNFDYNKEDQNEFKIHNLNIKDGCGNLIHTVQIKTKCENCLKKGGDEKNEGLPGWAIALIVIGAIIILGLIGFLVYRALKRRNIMENIEEGETKQLLE